MHRVPTALFLPHSPEIQGTSINKGKSHKKYGTGQPLWNPFSPHTNWGILRVVYDFAKLRSSAWDIGL